MPDFGLTTRAPRAYLFIGNLVLTLTFVGFAPTAALSQILGNNSSDLNNAYRILYLILCMILFLWTCGRRTFRTDYLVCAFLFFYSLRLVHDLGRSYFYSIDNDSLFFFVTVLAPTIAIGGARDWFEERLCMRLVVAIGGIGALLSIYALAMGDVSAATASQEASRATLEFLNPISVGYLGLFTGAAALMLLAQRPGRTAAFIYIGIAFLSGYLLISAASRGPVVAMVFALAITGAANRKASIFYLVGTMAGGLALAFFGLPKLITDRFEGVGTDASSLERFDALHTSLAEALNHPWLGYAYIDPVSNMYPHNLVVESAMALGFFGAALMILMQLSMVRQAWRWARRGGWFLPFAGAATIANAWMSGSLWGSALFYMLLWLLRDERSKAAKMETRRAGRPVLASGGRI